MLRDRMANYGITAPARASQAPSLQRLNLRPTRVPITECFGDDTPRFFTTNRVQCLSCAADRFANVREVREPRPVSLQECLSNGGRVRRRSYAISKSDDAKSSSDRLPTSSLTTSFGHTLTELQPQKLNAKCVLERRAAGGRVGALLPAMASVCSTSSRGLVRQNV